MKPFIFKIPFFMTLTGNSNDKLNDISRYAKRNANTPHYFIFYVIKPNDAGKLPVCWIHFNIFYWISFCYHVRMEIDNFFFALLYNNTQSIVQMLCNLSLRLIGLRDYITMHLNSNGALSYNKVLKIEIYFLNIISWMYKGDR